jgi:hypothetical protein
MRLIKGRAKHATERQRGEACEPLTAQTFAKAHSLRDCFAYQDSESGVALLCVTLECPVADSAVAERRALPGGT